MWCWPLAFVKLSFVPGAHIEKLLKPIGTFGIVTFDGFDIEFKVRRRFVVFVCFVLVWLIARARALCSTWKSKKRNVNNTITLVSEADSQIRVSERARFVVEFVIVAVVILSSCIIICRRRASSFSRPAAMVEQNIAKNRYGNILPRKQSPIEKKNVGEKINPTSSPPHRQPLPHA